MSGYSAFTGPGGSGASGGGIGSSGWNATIEAESPLIWLKLDETSGTAAAQSGSYVNGGVYDGVTLNQSPLLVPDASVDFDGTNDGITIATAVSGDFKKNSWTMETIYNTGAMSAGQSLWHAGNSSATSTAGFKVAIWPTGAIGIAGYADGAWRTVNSATGRVSANTTYVIGVTLNSISNVIEWYVDGVNVETGAWTWALSNTTTQPFHIGYEHLNAGDRYWCEGRMDQFVWWGRELSPADMAAHYASISDGGESSAFSAAVLVDTPLRYYRMDEPLGMLIDSGSNESDSTSVTGTPSYETAGLVPSDSNTSITFDGATDLFEGSQITINGVSGCFEFLFKRNGNPSAAETIFEQYDTGGTKGGILIGITTSGQLEFAGKVISSGSYKSNVTTAGYCDNAAHHVVMNVDAGVVAIYVDGSSVAMTNDNYGASGTLVTTTPYAIGARRLLTTSPTNHFEGVLDEFAGYFNPLSAGRITAHFDATGL